MTQTSDPIQQLTDVYQRGFKLIDEAQKQKVLLIKEKKEQARKEVKEMELKNIQAIDELRKQNELKLGEKHKDLESQVEDELKRLDEHMQAHYDEAVKMIVEAVFDI